MSENTENNSLTDIMGRIPMIRWFEIEKRLGIEGAPTTFQLMTACAHEKLREEDGKSHWSAVMNMTMTQVTELLGLTADTVVSDGEEELD